MPNKVAIKTFRKLPSRAKAREGLEVLRGEVQAHRDEVDADAAAVMEHLKKSPEQTSPFSDVVHAVQQPDYRIVEAVDLLANEGKVALDPKFSAVTLVISH